MNRMHTKTIAPHHLNTNVTSLTAFDSLGYIQALKLTLTDIYLSIQLPYESYLNLHTMVDDIYRFELEYRTGKRNPTISDELRVIFLIKSGNWHINNEIYLKQGIVGVGPIPDNRCQNERSRVADGSVAGPEGLGPKNSRMAAERRTITKNNIFYY